MRTIHSSLRLLGAVLLVAVYIPCVSAQSPNTKIQETGRITVDGHSIPFVVRLLPITSFPMLPPQIAEVLSHRECMIPQTYEAHHPENVVHASLARSGSSDWAVLCSAKGSVSLLVFLEGAFDSPVVLASSPETERLQPHDPSGVLGFNWGIDRATPRQVHDAQAGLERRPPDRDHDALADSILERRTVYHFYTNGVWTLLDLPD